MSVDTFITPGDGTFANPASVYVVFVEAWGGGGLGGDRYYALGGGGGGGGGFASIRVPVTPSTNYDYHVSAPDETTWFKDTATVLAESGNSASSISSQGASGGSGTFGKVLFTGGTGGASTANAGGGGGSSASPAGIGSNGADAAGSVGGAGATAPSGGGNGGTGGTPSVSGADGTAPGGGGGGSGSVTSSGNGTDGKLKLTYFTNTPAFDTSLYDRNSGTSRTVSYTCTSRADRFLLVSVDTAVSTITVTSATYNGVALSFIGKAANDPNGSIEYWGLVAPASGAHNIVVNMSMTTAITIIAVSYSNVQQVVPYESFNSNTGLNAGVANDATLTVTPTTDKCVVVSSYSSTSNGAPVSVGADQIAEENSIACSASSFSLPIVTAGATSMNWTGLSTTHRWTMIGLAIRPAQAAGAAGPANLKTLNGLAAASVKAINGLAIASVKTYNGLA